MSTLAADDAPYYTAALLPPDVPHWGAGGTVLYSTVLGQAATVSYGFLSSAAGLTGEDRLGFAPTSETQKAYIRQALAVWSSIANVTFTETSAASSAQIRFGTNRQNGISSGYAYYPSTSSTGGLTLMANDDSNNTNPAPGTYGYMTLVHEIGHAIGLKHPGNYNAGDTSENANAGPFLLSAEDNYAYSIMSYNENAALPTDTYQTQAAIYDIAAVQYLYGANMAAAPGNDTYTLNSGSFVTIWDPNGTNTLDAGVQTADAVINLGGGLSSIGGRLVAGVAYNSRITIARGGSGADTIYANDLGDTIDGGAGTDTVVFSGSSSAYSMGVSGGVVTVSRSGIINTLTNVETLQFSDRSVSTASLTGTTTGTTAVAGGAIYRFYNNTNGSHFFTASSDERDMVIRTWPTVFTYEGARFSSIASSQSGASPVYRFYNNTNGSHFYTISADERDMVIRTWPTVYVYEGQAYSAFPVGSAGASLPGVTALYRFYNTSNGSHFFTASSDERDSVIRTWPTIYTYEGIAYYVASATSASSALQAGADQLTLSQDPAVPAGFTVMEPSTTMVENGGWTIQPERNPLLAAGLGAGTAIVGTGDQPLFGDTAPWLQAAYAAA